jgi:hypothetical protein
LLKRRLARKTIAARRIIVKKVLIAVGISEKISSHTSFMISPFSLYTHKDLFINKNIV